MMTIKISSIAALALLLAAVSFNSLQSENKKRDYVGSEVCGTCHTAESIGNQYDKWMRTPHAKAMERLRTKAAVSLAEKLSIRNPLKNGSALNVTQRAGAITRRSAPKA